MTCKQLSCPEVQFKFTEIRTFSKCKGRRSWVLSRVFLNSVVGMNQQLGGQTLTALYNLNVGSCAFRQVQEWVARISCHKYKYYNEASTPTRSHYYYFNVVSRHHCTSQWKTQASPMRPHTSGVELDLTSQHLPKCSITDEAKGETNTTVTVCIVGCVLGAFSTEARFLSESKTSIFKKDLPLWKKQI